MDVSTPQSDRNKLDRCVFAAGLCSKLKKVAHLLLSAAHIGLVTRVKAPPRHDDCMDMKPYCQYYQCYLQNDFALREHSSSH